MIICIRTPNDTMASAQMRRLKPASLGLLLLAIAIAAPTAGRADTVASLLGNFTINQYCGLKLTDKTLEVHYVVVFGQLPALRELHLADTDGDGVTSQAERDAYIGKLAPGFAESLDLRVDGSNVPLHATHWTSSLPTEQGGFSLRVDVDFAAVLPAAAGDAPRKLEFTNRNYAGRMGWHEIVVKPAPSMVVFNTNAFSTSLTGGLAEALQSLPPAGPLDERTAYLSFGDSPPPGAALLTDRAGNGTAMAPFTRTTPSKTVGPTSESEWIALRTRQLVDAISGPHVAPRVTLLALLGALLLGAVHALSPGHGKTIVGAYLIGSRGTPRHAVFLGLTVTVTHTIGVFILGFATLYASRYIVPERLFPILSLISAILVLGMGIVLLVQRGRVARQALSTVDSAPLGTFHFVKSEAPASTGTRGLIFAPATQYVDATMHSHGGGPMHSHIPPGAAGEKITWRNLLTLGISGGLVPCPSAMVLLLAAIALNKTAYGMLLVVAFSVGLAITLTLVGVAFLYARNRFRSPSAGGRWAPLLPALSAGTITMVGIALCIGALRSFGGQF
jgi:nickel/cobalt transporter (NicO) family protein